MRINQYIAHATGLSRRAADKLLASHRVTLNGRPAKLGVSVSDGDQVMLDGKTLQLPTSQTVLLNKPVDYVCSRDGQGSKTVYDLLPKEFSSLKPIGRLDKNSSGLLLLTNDGDLAHKLTHPKFLKSKEYYVTLNKPLTDADRTAIEKGVALDDGPSALKLRPQPTKNKWKVIMSEGRNRQIRRTFDALGYKVTRLHRTSFGQHKLSGLPIGKFKTL